jgi:predicted permease
MLHDLRVAVRRIVKAPVFSGAVVVTLALCIGANTAIYSVIDNVLLRPLAYPEPDRLFEVDIRFRSTSAQGLETSVDGRTWFAIRDRADLVDPAVFSDWATGVNFGVGATAGYVRMQRVSSGFFRVLGVPPAVGRAFTAEEDRPGGPAVAILSQAVWSKFFNSDPAIIGRTVTLRGEPYLVTGVMPEGFRSSSRAGVWTPLRASTTGEGGGSNYGIVARLRPGVSWEQASAQLSNLRADLSKDHSLPAGAEMIPALTPLQQARASEVRTPLYILWVAVGAVLLIGCINIGGMILARASGRLGEIATRLALGASRAAIVRQLFTENLLLALAGGIAALGVAAVSLRGLGALGREFIPLLEDVRLDPRVLAAALLLTVASSIFFGLLPAVAAARTDLRAAHTASTRVAGRRRFVSLGLLATAQVALSIPLLIGGGLLLRTVYHLWNLDPGFNGRSVLTAGFSLDDARYSSAADMNRLFNQGLERIRQIPGVESAAVTLSLPYERPLNMGFRVAGPAEFTPKNPITNLAYVTPGYFETLQIALMRGRFFVDSDSADAEKVAVINRSFAEHYLSGHEPLDTVLESGGSAYRIVGVAGNTQQRPGWGREGPLAPMPMLYVPAAQFPEKPLRMIHTWFSPSWVVRSTRDRAALSNALGEAMRSVDPLLPISEFRALDEVKAGSLVMQRLMATLLGALSGLALLLTALGIYGLLANSVAERAHELGIRMALGSTTGGAVRTALRPGLVYSLTGVVIGLTLSTWTVRLAKGLVWGISPEDPMTFLWVVGTVMGVAALAGLLPAVRIARINPATSLRNE